MLLDVGKRVNQQLGGRLQHVLKVTRIILQDGDGNVGLVPLPTPRAGLVVLLEIDACLPIDHGHLEAMESKVLAINFAGPMASQLVHVVLEVCSVVTDGTDDFLLGQVSLLLKELSDLLNDVVQDEEVLVTQVL